jgi:predicted GIY-YIG superfamily endonuclease
MTIRYKIKENNNTLKDKEWKVYFIKCGDSNKSPVKIGYTSDLNQRMKSIQVGCPYKISLLFALPCESKNHAKLLEKFLHKQLWHRSHLCGEWFMMPNQSIPKLINKFNGAYKGEYGFEDTYLVKGDVYGLNIDAVKREN